MEDDHAPFARASTLAVAVGLLTVAGVGLAASQVSAETAPPGCDAGEDVGDDEDLGLLGSAPTSVDGVVAAETWIQPSGQSSGQWLEHHDARMDEKVVAAGAVAGNAGLALEFQVQVYDDCEEPPSCTLNPSQATVEACHVEGSHHHVRVETGPSLCLGNHLAGCPVGGLVVADPSPNPSAP